jgi:amidohydrolase
MNKDTDGVYEGYLARQRQRAQGRAREAVGEVRSYRGAPATLARHIDEAVDKVEDKLFELARDLYEHPEVGFQEVRSVGKIVELLAAHGVDVEVGAFGLETAFVASAGTAGPTIAVLAEYDALPGVGHGCGHNLIAASAVGAFLAVREIASELEGSVRLIGTPAEEGGGGKEIILAAGGFDDVDAAVMVHPGNEDVAATDALVGRRCVDVIYRGRTAHSAGSPFLGRNALDAAVTAYQGLAQLRQHILPGDRVHAIITDGGQAVNVVPERAALRLYVRSPELTTLEKLSQRVDKVLRSAAVATETECEIVWDVTPPYLPMRSNSVLADRYVAALAGIRDALPMVERGESGGSSDIGNVSQHVPAIHPTIAFVDDSIPGHSAERADHTVTESGRRAMRDGALALARVVGDFLTDRAIRADVADEFRAAGGSTRDLEEERT